MSELLKVDHALRDVLAQIRPLESERAPITSAMNRVLASDILSAEDVPPFPASAMDGYGVIAEDTQGASSSQPQALNVVMDVQAGDFPQGKIERGQAARIMTGAPVPEGVTAIVPVEQTNGDWRNPQPTIEIYAEASRNQHIRPIGENIKSGQVIVRAGTILRPQHIGVIASVGQAEVDVVTKAHAVILSTGDELVEIGEPPQPGQIRDANSLTIAGMVESLGGRATRLPIVRDTPEAVRAAFDSALALKPDLIISSGGVSVGAADFVRDILAEMGTINFWKVNLRPGKPLAFGMIGGVPFFGLPGNPVSVMVTFDVFVRPALLKQMRHASSQSERRAILKKSVKSDGRRTYVRVKLEIEAGQLYATETGSQSSGVLLSMVLADGLLILPEGTTEAQAGTAYPVRLLREIEE